MSWDLLNVQIADNPLHRWLLAFGILVGVTVVARIVVALARRQLHRLSERTATRVDDVISDVVDGTKWYLLSLIALRPSVVVLELPEKANTVIAAISMVALMTQIGIWVQRGVLGMVQAKTAPEDDDPAAETTQGAVAFLSKVVIWGVIVIITLGNLGIEVTALVAGLGIGGVAAALAVQNVLGDMIASLSIYLDRPFDLGDFITAGDHMGTVEAVHWRTTRVRALSGEEIIFPNADLARSRVRNYKRMAERRVAFGIGIEYNISSELVRSAKRRIREAIEAVDEVRFDRVHFKGFGDSALMFEAVYFVLSPDYAVYMDKQELVNLGIYERFEEDGIPFAFPTRTLNVRQDGPWEADVPATSERRPRAGQASSSS